jgi:hypothetical protein
MMSGVEAPPPPGCKKLKGGDKEYRIRGRLPDYLHKR